MKEMDMTKIILSLTAAAVIGAICIATAKNPDVASALAQTEGYTAGSAMKDVPGVKFSGL
jgi:hypothetical protein